MWRGNPFQIRDPWSWMTAKALFTRRTFCCGNFGVLFSKRVKLAEMPQFAWNPNYVRKVSTKKKYTALFLFDHKGLSEHLLWSILICNSWLGLTYQKLLSNWNSIRGVCKNFINGQVLPVIENIYSKLVEIPKQDNVILKSRVPRNSLHLLQPFYTLATNCKIPGKF